MARCWSPLSLLYRGKWVNVSPAALRPSARPQACAPRPRAPHRDGRKKVAGENVNFFVYYIVDDDISQHNLKLEGYWATAPMTPLGPA